ncbi:hypothetical protein PLICRDRAFT_698613 [Plicaturopsis crispa FD-325 SS-3]|nr:hypothetical protein PLICRDRAFT_698613 [Plicaturopsis crispa FD-325 SS-3]
MLALATKNALTLIDPATLRRTPAAAPSTQPLDSLPTATAWAPDNSALFLASGDSIHKFDVSKSHLFVVSVLHSVPGQGLVSHIIAKDRSVIFALANKVHVLEGGKVTRTLDSQKAAITSLSLSNDGSLLASTTVSAAHVYNLSLGSHTVLRGLPAPRITACAFHPHARTRLLIGAGKHVLVYDTTRPSSPAKTISLAEGETVNAIACSPFSKTLVAVSTVSGTVGLMDLDKEKALFRTLDFKVPLTSASFSPEGAAMYFTTENGKLLIMDLRALDKPPKSIVVSETGARIECMSVQKSKTTSSKTAPRTAAPAKAAVPTARVRSGIVPTRSPVAASKASPRAKPVLSPIRDPFGNGDGDISMDIDVAKHKRPVQRKVSAPVAAQTTKRASPVASAAKKSPPLKAGSAVKASPPSRLARSPSPGSSTGEEDLSVRIETLSAKLGARSKPSASSKTGVSAASAQSSVRTPSPDLPPISAQSSLAPALATRRSASAVSALSTAVEDELEEVEEDEPSLDQPPMPTSRATPLPRAGTRGVLGLGTPEVAAWIQAGKGKEKEDQPGKRVGFADEADSDEEEARELSMQVSPRRPPPAAWTAVPSPLRPQTGGSPDAGGAHDLLRSIVREAMSDVQRETKAELTGLHLDLVRMGRGWRREVRSVMEEYGEDLRALREENARLREENERLRRGY